jgi:LysM repeat protein
MDTISRENNSILPIAGVLVGVLALILSGVALAKLSSANRQIAELKDSMTKVDALEAEVRSATTSADQARSAAESTQRGLNSLQTSVQGALDQVGAELGKLRADMQAAQAPRAAAKAGAAEKGPVVAGEGEYVIQKGDYGAKIAKNHGVSLADLQAVNPGVDLAKVRIGQKIKLPKK